uniref:Sulfatase N-terminal domain-containing protein n=1 Tax=Eptatretus burgeri TaxID=7764 RepID=A0A8C4QK01_EPTBU
MSWWTFRITRGLSRSVAQSPVRPPSVGSGMLLQQFNQILPVLLLSVCFASHSTPTDPHTEGAPRPHIIFLLADDQGWGDVGYHSAGVQTPTMDQLSGEGVRLESYYVQPLCTPSRSALMTGRYEIHTGLQHSVIRLQQPTCLPTDGVTLPKLLATHGYSCHMVGKWHLGYSHSHCLPTSNGFHSFFGHLGGSADHYTRLACAGRGLCGFDMMEQKVETEWTEGSGASGSWNMENSTAGERNAAGLLRLGEYSTEMFAKRAEEIISRHAETEKESPLFMYVAFTAPHAPLQAPRRYAAPHRAQHSVPRRTFLAMLSALDAAVANITRSLQGGVRSVGFLHSPLIPVHHRGVSSTSLIHITDWLPTFARLAGAKLPSDGPTLDGYDQWDAITRRRRSPRTEILHNIDLLRKVPVPLPSWPPPSWGWDPRVQAAVRVGRWKLLTGSPGQGDWVPPPGMHRAPPQPPGAWWRLEWVRETAAEAAAETDEVIDDEEEEEEEDMQYHTNWKHNWVIDVDGNIVWEEGTERELEEENSHKNQGQGNVQIKVESDQVRGIPIQEMEEIHKEQSNNGKERMLKRTLTKGRSRRHPKRRQLINTPGQETNSSIDHQPLFRTVISKGKPNQRTRTTSTRLQPFRAEVHPKIFDQPINTKKINCNIRTIKNSKIGCIANQAPAIPRKGKRGSKLRGQFSRPSRKETSVVSRRCHAHNHPLKIKKVKTPAALALKKRRSSKDKKKQMHAATTKLKRIPSRGRHTHKSVKGLGRAERVCAPRLSIKRKTIVRSGGNSRKMAGKLKNKSTRRYNQRLSSKRKTSRANKRPSTRRAARKHHSKKPSTKLHKKITVMSLTRKQSIRNEKRKKKKILKDVAHTSGTLKLLWLFDIHADPYERHDLSALYPHVVRALLTRLVHFNKSSTPARFLPYDRKARPGPHGFWRPWLPQSLSNGSVYSTSPNWFSSGANENNTMENASGPDQPTPGNGSNSTEGFPNLLSGHALVKRIWRTRQLYGRRALRRGIAGKGVEEMILNGKGFEKPDKRTSVGKVHGIAGKRKTLGLKKPNKFKKIAKGKKQGNLGADGSARKAMQRKLGGKRQTDKRGQNKKNKKETIQGKMRNNRCRLCGLLDYFKYLNLRLMTGRL